MDYGILMKKGLYLSLIGTFKEIINKTDSNKRYKIMASVGRHDSYRNRWAQSRKKQNARLFRIYHQRKR